MPDTPTTSDLITFGPPNQVIISVLPDMTMIDFAKAKLVKVDLEYTDAAHRIDVKKEFVLKQGATLQPWTVYARDPNLTQYNWTATFYLGTAPPTTVTTSGQSSDSDLILMMPS